MLLCLNFEAGHAVGNDENEINTHKAGSSSQLRDNDVSQKASTRKRKRGDQEDGERNGKRARTQKSSMATSTSSSTTGEEDVPEHLVYDIPIYHRLLMDCFYGNFILPNIRCDNIKYVLANNYSHYNEYDFFYFNIVLNIVSCLNSDELNQNDENIFFKDNIVDIEKIMYRCEEIISIYAELGNRKAKFVYYSFCNFVTTLEEHFTDKDFLKNVQTKNKKYIAHLKVNENFNKFLDVLDVLKSKRTSKNASIEKVTNALEKLKILSDEQFDAAQFFLVNSALLGKPIGCDLRKDTQKIMSAFLKDVKIQELRKWSHFSYKLFLKNNHSTKPKAIDLHLWAANQGYVDGFLKLAEALDLEENKNLWINDNFKELIEISSFFTENRYIFTEIQKLNPDLKNKIIVNYNKNLFEFIKNSVYENNYNFIEDVLLQYDSLINAKVMLSILYLYHGNNQKKYDSYEILMSIDPKFMEKHHFIEAMSLCEILSKKEDISEEDRQKFRTSHLYFLSFFVAEKMGSFQHVNAYNSAISNHDQSEQLRILTEQQSIRLYLEEQYQDLPAIVMQNFTLEIKKENFRNECKRQRDIQMVADQQAAALRQAAIPHFVQPLQGQPLLANPPQAAVLPAVPQAVAPPQQNLLKTSRLIAFVDAKLKEIEEVEKRHVVILKIGKEKIALSKIDDENQHAHTLSKIYDNYESQFRSKKRIDGNFLINKCNLYLYEYLKYRGVVKDNLNGFIDDTIDDFSVALHMMDYFFQKLKDLIENEIKIEYQKEKRLLDMPFEERMRFYIDQYREFDSFEKKRSFVSEMLLFGQASLTNPIKCNLGSAEDAGQKENDLLRDIIGHIEENKDIKNVDDALKFLQGLFCLINYNIMISYEISASKKTTSDILYHVISPQLFGKKINLILHSEQTEVSLEQRVWQVYHIVANCWNHIQEIKDKTNKQYYIEQFIEKLGADILCIEGKQKVLDSWFHLVQSDMNISGHKINEEKFSSPADFIMASYNQIRKELENKETRSLKSFLELLRTLRPVNISENAADIIRIQNAKEPNINVTLNVNEYEEIIKTAQSEINKQEELIISEKIDDIKMELVKNVLGKIVGDIVIDWQLIIDTFDCLGIDLGEMPIVQTEESEDQSNDDGFI